jgi:class 3 adenylate cyclase/tetratricopeptide (TPR) repeat protein
MRCASCDSANAESARFCGTCGARLTATCPHCRSEVTPGLRFCNACGGPMPELPGIGASGERAADSSLPSERRLVSVLFVDLENFTALAESLDPEDVRSLQSRYFEVARSAVARYGGTLEKFIGDAIMAVWGAPSAHEDDGERAVRAALDLVAAVAKLRGPVPGRRLTARAAVATGEAAVTLGVEGQGMVAGDLVNTAARLQAAAPPNGVMVDETTRRVVGEAVIFEAESAVMLKGKSKAVATWLATGLADVRGRGRAAGHSGTFVGRQAELEELIELYRRAVADRRGRLISVLGIAGIGKSRLTWEFERHLDALPDPVALHLGRAPAYGEGITFAPLAEMVRRRAGISEGTDAEVARRQLATTLAELVSDEAERQWIEPRLATLLDPGSHVAYERDELFASWRRFFERVSEWAPALLVFEDLQWADPALLDFIDHMATWSRGHPILIVALARPELLDRRPTWGAGQRSFTAIHLERLGDEAMADLLMGLAPGMPEPAVRHVLDRAGGVPLYGVEVVRMLVDRGQLVARNGSFELLEPIDRVQVPETLHALISARIDALPPAERGVLLSAAALGRRFHPDALAAISGLEPAEARERMGGLVRRELLAVDDELRSPGHGQLSFVQDVVREVAYRTLSRRERRALHLAAADHLESLHEADLVEAMAEHLVEAHRAAPDHLETPLVAVRAVGALREAARRALALHVPVRALTHLEQALGLVADDETRATLWEEAAAAARAVPRFEAAEELLRQLIAWRTDNGERAKAARARAQLASLLLATERHGSALGDLEAALQGIADLASDPDSVELSGQLARAHMLVGDYEQALDWADRTLEVAGRLGLSAVAVDALITRGTAEMRLGDESAGLADLRRAIAQAQQRGVISAELRARNNLAWLVVADDPHATMDSARGGMELATRMGVGDMALQFAEVACAVAVDTGDWDWALATLAEFHDQPQAPAHRIQFAASEAILRALRGDADAGAVLEALEPLDPETDPQILAAIDLAAAWIAFLDHRLEDARRLADVAAARSLGAEQHAAFSLAARASLWLHDADRAAVQLAAIGGLRTRGRAVDAIRDTLRAGISALTAQPDEAEAGYRAAADRLRALELPLQLGICLLERATFLPTSDPAGRGEAISVLERIGAGALLADLREPTRRP